MNLKVEHSVEHFNFNFKNTFKNKANYVSLKANRYVKPLYTMSNTSISLALAKVEA